MSSHTHSSVASRASTSEAACRDDHTAEAVPHVPSSAHPLSAGRRCLSSRELLAGADEIEIDHDGRLYRLRVTALGKLILTK